MIETVEGFKAYIYWTHHFADIGFDYEPPCFSKEVREFINSTDENVFDPPKEILETEYAKCFYRKRK